jgi:hypothetical protein
MSKDDPVPAVRITNQFRKGPAMVYDLSCEAVRLTIEMRAREGDDGLGDWNVAAHAREAPERPTIEEAGVTRSDGLRAVAASWAAKRGAYGFPALDWEGVTRALLAVRAI